MKALRGFMMAWGNFSKIPCPSHKWDEEARVWMLFFLPFIGAVGGVLMALALVVLTWAGLPWILTGALLTAMPFFVFGPIHHDGYMDLWDALLSARPDREERVRILKDPGVGAMGVMTMTVTLILTFGAMCTIAQVWETEGPVWMLLTLATVPFMSRTMSVAAVLAKKPMEGSQYATLTRGRETSMGAVGVVILWAMVTLFILAAAVMFEDARGAYMLIPMVSGISAGMCLTEKAVRDLGGMNGDISGAVTVFSETWSLVVLAVVCAVV